MSAHEMLERAAKDTEEREHSDYLGCRPSRFCDACIAAEADATALRELARLVKAYNEACDKQGWKFRILAGAGVSHADRLAQHNLATAVVAARDNLLHFLRTDPTQTPENK